MISEWLSKGVSVKSFDPFVKVVVTPFCHPRQKYFGPSENFKDHLKRWFCSIKTRVKLMFVQMGPNWGFMGNMGGKRRYLIANETLYQLSYDPNGCSFSLTRNGPGARENRIHSTTGGRG